MNNLIIEINDSKGHHKNQYLESIQNDTKFYKKLLKEDQQSEEVSLEKKLNNNCVPSSFNLMSKNENQTQLNNLNDECLIHIFHGLPIHDQERAAQVCQRWRRLVAESSGLSVINENSNKNSNFDMTGNCQNCKGTVLQDDINCTIEINNDLYHVGNIITPKVFLCPIYTICLFGIIIGISIVYLFYTVMVFPGHVM